MNSEATTHLVLEVFLHEGRYHGVPDWPPAPARVFQALVAGSSRGADINPRDVEVLAWLESLDAPSIGAPIATQGQEVGIWVPNNDLDAKGGDPARVGDIRTQKKVRPWIFDGEVPLLYVWRLVDPQAPIEGVQRLADRLYQLGRGVDMAWAQSSLLSTDLLEAKLEAYPGVRLRPGPGRGGVRLDVPQPGSFASLQTRFRALGTRFETQKVGRKAVTVFSQAPKPRFGRMTYEARPERRLFEVEVEGRPGKLGAVPLVDACNFTTQLRDQAAARLTSSCPEFSPAVERALIGRTADGLRAKPNLRVRILPLPSHGHPKVDPSIRRVLVEVPAGCELRSSDIFWAFADLVAPNQAGAALRLVATEKLDMLGHYGATGTPSRVWRSVTPVALPEPASRRRIDPRRQKEEAKNASERHGEEHRARAAVAQALRHSGLTCGLQQVHVRREPFTDRGARAEAFESKPRFVKERLWHVEIELDRAVAGPVCIGDGRFLGLGILAPYRPSVPDIFVFEVVDGLVADAHPEVLVRAFRRAMLARVQAELGPGKAIPQNISGHEPDGRPSKAEHDHVAVLFDPVSHRFIVAGPGHLNLGRSHDGWVPSGHLLDKAFSGLHTLLAGRAGRLQLRRASPDAHEIELLGAAKRWVSVTPYLVTRHSSCGDPRDALAADLRQQCVSTGLPTPRIEVLEYRGIKNRGLEGRAVLHFATSVRGPLVLGRSRHLGGGLFRPQDRC